MSMVKLAEGYVAIQYLSYNKVKVDLNMGLHCLVKLRLSAHLSNTSIGMRMASNTTAHMSLKRTVDTKTYHSSFFNYLPNHKRVEKGPQVQFCPHFLVVLRNQGLLSSSNTRNRLLGIIRGKGLAGHA